MGKWDMLIKIGKVTLPVIGFAAGQALGAIKDKEADKALDEKVAKATEKAFDKFLSK
jgi:hypothetical protein